MKFFSVLLTVKTLIFFKANLWIMNVTLLFRSIFIEEFFERIIFMSPDFMSPPCGGSFFKIYPIPRVETRGYNYIVPYGDFLL